MRLGRWATLFEALIKLLMTIGGGLAAFDALVRHVHWSEPWQGTLLVLSVFLFLQLLGLPFALWRTFRIEAHFGFNRISPRLFPADLAKRLLLGLALGAPLVLATLALMERAGAWWWVWAWLVWLGASLGLTWAAPRFIAPLFNRFSPLGDTALRQRVETLLERCGFAARGGVFVMDGSRRSAHGNAYFTGIGRNKRIVFFDTLLARIDAEEIEAVLAHELGHFRLHHVLPATGRVGAVGARRARAARLARAPARLLYRARRTVRLARHGIAAVRAGRAGRCILRDAARVVVVAPAGARRRRFRRAISPSPADWPAPS